MLLLYTYKFYTKMQNGAILKLLLWEFTMVAHILKRKMFTKRKLGKTL